MPENAKSVRSTCPYCGVGCQIELKIQNNRIIRVDAPFDVAPNYGRLCTKGRFGVDFVHHPSRLTHPLIRKELGTKPRKPTGIEGFRAATWDEALDLAASKLAEIVRYLWEVMQLVPSAPQKRPMKTIMFSRNL